MDCYSQKHFPYVNLIICSMDPIDPNFGRLQLTTITQCMYSDSRLFAQINDFECKCYLDRIECIVAICTDLISGLILQKMTLF